jgi:hypothetical protein
MMMNHPLWVLLVVWGVAIFEPNHNTPQYDQPHTPTQQQQHTPKDTPKDTLQKTHSK